MTIKKIKSAWKKFYDHEYATSKVKESTLRLFAVDCGGYDTTKEVELIMKKDKIFLVFSKYNGVKGDFVETEQFELMPK